MYLTVSSYNDPCDGYFPRPKDNNKLHDLGDVSEASDEGHRQALRIRRLYTELKQTIKQAVAPHISFDNLDELTDTSNGRFHYYDALPVSIGELADAPLPVKNINPQALTLLNLMIPTHINLFMGNPGVNASVFVYGKNGFKQPQQGLSLEDAPYYSRVISLYAGTLALDDALLAKVLAHEMGHHGTVPVFDTYADVGRYDEQQSASARARHVMALQYKSGKTMVDRLNMISYNTCSILKPFVSSLQKGMMQRAEEFTCDAVADWLVPKASWRDVFTALTDHDNISQRISLVERGQLLAKDILMVSKNDQTQDNGYTYATHPHAIRRIAASKDR